MILIDEFSLIFLTQIMLLMLGLNFRAGFHTFRIGCNWKRISLKGQFTLRKYFLNM